MLQMRRDPFARQNLLREKMRPGYYPGNAPLRCEWCGSQKRDGSMFRYHTASDGGREYLDTRLFCCVGCRDSYYS